MLFTETLEKRRSYRTLGKTDITDREIQELAQAASLAPSCMNNQPWRYVFVRNPELLAELCREAIPPSNGWAYKSSLIIAVYTAVRLDCQIEERTYAQFDTGIATGFILLKATELGLVAHPFAGFTPQAAKKVLQIEDDMELICLIAVGKMVAYVSPELSPKSQAAEKVRPERLSFEEFARIDI